MKISLIAAMANNNVIGNNGKMPWHLPVDLKRVKALTLGKPIIMGRKTYESIGKPLPGRMNIIISRQTNLSLEGCTVVTDLDEAITAASTSEADEAIIFGGSQIYQLAMPQVTTMYLTLIEKDYPGDTFFPEWNENEWQQTENEAFSTSDFTYRFLTLVRRPE